MSAKSKPFRSGKGSLEERLAQHPELKAKIESLLSVVENTDSDLREADAAEEQVIEELRGIGQATLTGWAEQVQETARESFVQGHPKAHRSRKKNSTGTVD